jgi:hypothetical protein
VINTHLHEVKGVNIFAEPDGAAAHGYMFMGLLLTVTCCLQLQSRYIKAGMLFQQHETALAHQ